MNAKFLIKGLEILQKEFGKMDWNISSDGETIVVWDATNPEKFDLGCEQVSDQKALEKLGWYYDEQEKAWSPLSPIYNDTLPWLYPEDGATDLPARPKVDDIINIVNDIQYLIVKAGGMATKSIVEKILMIRYPGLDHADARSITNDTEYKNQRDFRLNPLQWATNTRPEPDYTDWPEVLNFKPEYKYIEQSTTLLKVRRQFDRVVFIYRTDTIMPEEAELIAVNYSFLVPVNGMCGAAALAEAMLEYSGSAQTKFLAGLLHDISEKERQK